MESNLLKQTLADLRAAFADVRKRGRLRILLVETPLSAARFKTGDLPGVRGDAVWVRTFAFPELGQSDPKSPGTTRTMAAEVGHSDPSGTREGKPQRDVESQPSDDAAREVVRLIRVEGDSDVWQEFSNVAANAGHVLESASTLIQDRFRSETLRISELSSRWLCSLFDLAWAKIPGSPLRPETDKSVQVEFDPDVIDPDTVPGDLPAGDFGQPTHREYEPGPDVQDPPDDTGVDTDVAGVGHHTAGHQPGRRKSCGWFKSEPWIRDILLTDWSHFTTEHPWRDAVRGMHDPPEWFSALADAVEASVFAADIMLSDLAHRRATSAEPPTTPSIGDASAGVSLQEACKNLQPAHRKAYFAYRYAEQQLGDKPTGEAVYDWLKEHTPVEGEMFQELDGYELPTFHTFTKYLRVARGTLGTSKYSTRAGRPTGKSITRPDEM